MGPPLSMPVRWQKNTVWRLNRRLDNIKEESHIGLLQCRSSNIGEESHIELLQCILLNVVYITVFNSPKNETRANHIVE